jgi:RNA polymerase sigma factor (sigma-70 family)
MASGRLSGQVHQYLRKLLHPREGKHVPDGLLLERYASHRDEAAFAALVQRYGPLVLGVCERVLPDGNDAEDAFQATFLVLVRKAGSLDRRGTLSHWLYTVAYRTAVKLKVSAARRRSHERQGLDMPATQSVTERSWKDLRPVIDEELNRLPPKYRAPLVLCYLEGKTHVQAARDLGWPSGSVSRRMSRAREMLRRRLLRRGVAVSTALLVSLVAKNAQASVVPLPLAASTVKAAMAFKAGTGVFTGLISAKVAALAHEVLLTVAASKVTIASLLLPALVTVGLIGTTAGLLLHRAAPDFQSNVSTVFANSQTSPVGGFRWRVQDSFDVTNDAVLAVAMNPEGNLLATGSRLPDLVVRLWDLAAGREVGQLIGHTGSVHAVAFSPNGRKLATGSQDRTVRLWDVTSRKELATLRGHTVGVLAVAFSPDGETIASAGLDRTIRLWNAASGQERTYLLGHRLPITALAYSPDGSILASAGQDGTVRLWNPRSGRELAVLKGHTDVVSSLAFSRDGKRLVTGSWDHTIRLWDVNSRTELATLTGHTDRVRCVGFSPDGNMILSGGQDRSLRLWSLGRGLTSLILVRHTDSVNCLSCASATMRLATGSADKTVNIWQFEAPAEQRSSDSSSDGWQWTHSQTLRLQ